MNNKNLFLEAFDAIDDKLLAEAKHPSIRIAARCKKIMISSIAACVAAVLVVIPSIKILVNLNDSNFTTSDDIEIIYQEDISYIEETNSKEQVSSQQAPQPQTNSTQGSTNSNDYDYTNINEAPAGIDDITINVEDLYFTNTGVNSPTTTYEKVYSPNVEYLYINPIPNDKYVTIYQEYYQKELDKTEVQTLTDKYFPKMAAALNIPLLPYEIKNVHSDSIDVDGDNPFHFSHSYNKNTIGYNSGSIVLNGKPVTVNQAQSDEEIINSISDIKQILCDIFDVNFDAVKINREYTATDNHGASRLTVLFYDSNAHPLNDLAGIRPSSDYISIDFFNNDDTASDTNLYEVFNIWYRAYRTDNHSPLTAIAKKELLPLEKAEEYLQKGYVLAMGGCSLCQAEQAPVDFTDYDYVSFEYAGGYEIGDLTLPYYAFYKNIGTAQNGNMIFAKAYVPAVEVEGYDEYFINKHSNHNNSDDYVLEETVE